MKRLLSLSLLFICFTSPFSLISQIIQQSYKLQTYTQLALADGSYLLGGQSDEVPYPGVGFVMRWHPEKGMIFVTELKGGSIPRVMAISQFPDGDFLVAGGSMNMTGEVWVISDAGEMKRKIDLPCPGAVFCSRIEADGIVLGGFFQGQSGNNWGAIKLSLEGNLLWTCPFGAGGNPVDDFASSIVYDDGKYFLGGTLAREMTVICLDKSGELLWQTKVDDAYSETNQLILHPSGNLWLTGQGDYHHKTPKPKGGVAIASLDKTGEVLWVKYYESKYSASGEGLLPLPDGRTALLTRLPDSGVRSGIIWIDKNGQETSRKMVSYDITLLFGLHFISENQIAWFEMDRGGNHKNERKVLAIGR